MVIALQLVAAGCLSDRAPSASVSSAPSVAAATAAPEEGGGLPNLIVDTAKLAHSWIVYDQDLDKKDPCGPIEGGVTPGMHRVLRFSVTTPNIGTADLVVGDPLAHVRAGDGLFEFASCHFHFHLRHYAIYELVSVASGEAIVVRGAKRGFCMIDTTPWQFDGGVGSPTYRTCGTFAIPGNQGISVGWADTYDKHIGGQYFVLDGGDGQPVVPPGEYILRATVNPPYACSDADRAHNRPVDANGMCRNFVESNYDDNVGEVRITLPEHTGKTGFGPGPAEPSDTDATAAAAS